MTRPTVESPFSSSSRDRYAAGYIDCLLIGLALLWVAICAYFVIAIIHESDSAQRNLHVTLLVLCTIVTWLVIIFSVQHGRRRIPIEDAESVDDSNDDVEKVGDIEKDGEGVPPVTKVSSKRAKLQQSSLFFLRVSQTICSSVSSDFSKFMQQSQDSRDDVEEDAPSSPVPSAPNDDGFFDRIARSPSKKIALASWVLLCACAFGSSVLLELDEMGYAQIGCVVGFVSVLIWTFLCCTDQTEIVEVDDENDDVKDTDEEDTQISRTSSYIVKNTIVVGDRDDSFSEAGKRAARKDRVFLSENPNVAFSGGRDPSKRTRSMVSETPSGVETVRLETPESGGAGFFSREESPRLSRREANALAERTTINSRSRAQPKGKYSARMIKSELESEFLHPSGDEGPSFEEEGDVFDGFDDESETVEEPEPSYLLDNRMISDGDWTMRTVDSYASTAGI